MKTKDQDTAPAANAKKDEPKKRFQVFNGDTLTVNTASLRTAQKELKALRAAKTKKIVFIDHKEKTKQTHARPRYAKNYRVTDSNF